MEEKDIEALVSKLDKSVSKDQLKTIIKDLKEQSSSASPSVKKDLQKEIDFWTGVHNSKSVAGIRSSTEGLKRHLQKNAGDISKYASSRGMLGLITKESSQDLYTPEQPINTNGIETPRTSFKMPGAVGGKPVEASVENPITPASGGGQKATTTSLKKKREVYDVPEPISNSIKSPIRSLDELNALIKSKAEGETLKVGGKGVEGNQDGSGYGIDSEAIRRAKLQKTLNNISSIGGLAVNLGDLISARRDVKKAENLRDNITDPSYSVRGKNRGLLREIRDADTKRMNPYGITAPVQDQINQGFNQDINVAQTVSGGQAGTFGSLAGASALRRDKNLTSLGGIAAGAVGAQDERMAGLLGAQAQDDSNRDYLNLFKYQQDQGVSTQEGMAVGDAISSSRLRQIQSRNDLLNNLITSPVFDAKAYKNLLQTSLTSKK